MADISFFIIKLMDINVKYKPVKKKNFTHKVRSDLKMGQLKR